MDRVNAALYAPTVPEAAARQVWRERLAAIDGTFDLAVDRLSYDALRGQDLRLRLGLQDGRVAIEEARVGDLGAASLLASGAVDLADDSYDLTGTVEMAQPKPILRLLRMEPPPELQRLAPLRLSGTAKGSGLTGSELDLRLQATGATASLKGTLGGPPDGSAVRTRGQRDRAGNGRAADGARLAGTARPPRPGSARAGRRDSSWQRAL